jgi:hypothetical protein
MASLSAYAITLGSTDYPVKYAGLLSYVEPYLTNLESFTFSAGNLGLGVTPSAWGSGKAFEIGSGGNGIWSGSGYTSLLQNTAFTSGAYRYVTSQTAARFDIENNTFKWFTAPSGTAGNAISFTQALTLDASGNWGVGTTNPAAYAAKMMLVGSASSQNLLTVQDSGTSYGASKYYQWFINSAGASAGWITHTEAQGIGLGSDSALLFYSGGATERARITSGGDLLVGTTSTTPVSTITVATSDGSAPSNATTKNAIRIRSTATAGVGVGPSIIFEGQTGNSSSNYGFAAIQGFKASATASDYSGALAFYTQASGGGTLLDERARITSGGNLLVGTQTAGAGAGFDTRLAVEASAIDTSIFKFTGAAVAGYPVIAWHSATTGDNLLVRFATEGTITTRGSITYNRGAGQVAYNITSDARLKENIANADDAGSKVDALQVRKFDWKETGNHVDYGFVAQELEPIVPHAVSKPEAEDEMWSVDYSKLVPMLIKEIQTLRARVAALESN